MVTLPTALLDALHARLLENLPAHPSRPEIAERVIGYLRNTAETTVTVQPDPHDPSAPSTTFVITGDIPAMWLRDSAAQLTPLLRILATDLGAEADRAELEGLLVGLLRRQWRQIAHDPYANAFNRTADGRSWDEDDTDVTSPWVWERKFELDSLSYGPDLAWRLHRATGTTAFLDDSFRTAARRILETVATEQDHEARSSYYFRRRNCPPSDTLERDGRGREVAPCGLVWSGFRPSDDACELGYNVPGNHFLALALVRLADLLALDGDEDGATRARDLAASIREGLEEHGTMRLPDGREVRAYEVDGQGNALFMDDANVPSLLSLPYLGCVEREDPLTVRTREAVLGAANPQYWEGAALQGVGSPHTPPRHVWPIALAIQGLTSDDQDEKRRLLETMMATDGGTGMMHEGVHVDDPSTFTRAWFSWSNMMFCELAMDLAGLPGDGLQVSPSPPCAQQPLTGIETMAHPLVHLAVVRRTDYPMAQLPALMDGVFSHLPQALAQQGVQISGPALSQHARMPSDTCDLEVGFPVTQLLTESFVLPNGFEVVPGTLPAAPVAMTSHVGPYEELGRAWGAFIERLHADGLQPDVPFWEIYVTAPEPGADPANLRTDLATSLHVRG